MKSAYEMYRESMTGSGREPLSQRAWTETLRGTDLTAEQSTGYLNYVQEATDAGKPVQSAEEWLHVSHGYNVPDALYLSYMSYRKAIPRGEWPMSIGSWVNSIDKEQADNLRGISVDEWIRQGRPVPQPGVAPAPTGPHIFPGTDILTLRILRGEAKLLNFGEVREQLAVSASTLRRWVKEKQFPGPDYVYGRWQRWSSDTVDAHIEAARS